MSQLLEYVVEGGVAILSANQAPANALDVSVRSALMDALKTASEDKMVGAVAIVGSDGIFSGGGDYSGLGQPSSEPALGAMCTAIEAMEKPVVAGLTGVVLGGGLELALACHYRVAHAETQLAMPEVALGVMPGAGGTQRAPRLIGAEAALNLFLSGAVMKPTSPELAGMIDEIAEDDLREATVLFALTCIAKFKPPRPTRDVFEGLADFGAHQKAIETWRKRIATRGQDAAAAILECVRVAPLLPFDVGLEFERDRFEELIVGDQCAALRHVAVAERPQVRFPEMTETLARSVQELGVIVGRDRQGADMALSALRHGLKVVMVAQVPAALELAKKRVEGALQRQVTNGHLSATQADQMRSALSTPTDLVALSSSDMVIEMVGLGPQVSRQIIAQLDGIVEDGAVMVVHDAAASLKELSQATGSPEDLLSLFVPNLYLRTSGVEMGVGPSTSPEAMATCFETLTRIGYFPMRARAHDGLIGQNVMGACIRAVEDLVRQGADPYEVDRVMMRWGMARGPLQVADAIGLNAPGLRDAGASLSAALYKVGREGRDARRGWYHYSTDHPFGAEDPETQRVIKNTMAQTPQATGKTGLDEADIEKTCLAAMANAGARLLRLGVVKTPAEIDVALIHGFGFPRWRGGPMMASDHFGLIPLRNQLRLLAEGDAAFWKTEVLFDELIKNAAGFASLNATAQ